MTIRVLLADDHEVVRAGLARLIEQIPDLELAGEACNGDVAYRMIQTIQPDILVLDLSMPGASGLELLRRLLSRAPRTRILVFTIHDSPAIATRALQAGARGYLSKASPGETLIRAIRTVALGRVYVCPDIAQKLALMQIAGDEGPLSKLSAREAEILRLFATGEEIRGIAAALFVSPKTVANQISLIKQKLGIRSGAALYRLASQHLEPGDARDWGL